MGGTLVNSVIYTFPAISQFGSYKPEEFLANPVYSRDYPPLRPCKIDREDRNVDGGGGGGWCLALDAVAKTFGGLRAVDGVSLQVRAGERRAIIGPNGAGKTTLFTSLAGAPGDVGPGGPVWAGYYRPAELPPHWSHFRTTMVHHYWNVYCTTSENSQLSILCGFLYVSNSGPTAYNNFCHACTNYNFMPLAGSSSQFLFLWSLTVVYKASRD